MILCWKCIVVCDKHLTMSRRGCIHLARYKTTLSGAWSLRATSELANLYWWLELNGFVNKPKWIYWDMWWLELGWLLLKELACSKHCRIGASKRWFCKLACRHFRIAIDNSPVHANTPTWWSWMIMSMNSNFDINHRRSKICMKRTFMTMFNSESHHSHAQAEYHVLPHRRRKANHRNPNLFLHKVSSWTLKTPHIALPIQVKWRR